MKKLIVGFLFVFLLTSIACAGVYDNVASDISSKLHIVNGTILSVQNKRKVILNKGYDDGLYKNSIVYIYKKEGYLKLFNDNKTVALKKGIAYAYVSKLFAHKAQAVIATGIEREKDYLIGLGIIPWGEKELIGKPKAGYNFVAGKKEYRVAIITRNPIIFSSLKSALEKTGRFFVISPDTLAIAITNRRINTLGEKSSIAKLAQAVDADLVMLVSTREYKTLRCKVYNGYASNVILTLNEKVDQKSRIVLLNNEKSNLIPPKNLVASRLRLTPKLTFWESLLGRFGLYSPYTGLELSSSQYKISLYKNIGYGTTAFYLGDVTGNNQREIVVAQGSKVTVYDFDFDSFIKKGNFSYGYNIINIDSARFDGKTLIAISNFNSYGSLDSAIGYLDKNYRLHIIKKGLPYHIRFYNKFSNPEIIAQKASVGSVFMGPIYTLNINTGNVKKLSLPVTPKSFYTFERIGNNIAYLSKSGQLCLYSLDKGKTVQRTAYALGGGDRAIERYHYEPNNEQSVHEIEAMNDVYVPKGIVFFKAKNGSIYALGAKNYISHNITINKQHYDAYSLKLFKYNSDRFALKWSSGDVKGRIVGYGKFDDYVVSVIGLPAGFFDRFIGGITEVDRLSAGHIEQ